MPLLDVPKTETWFSIVSHARVAALMTKIPRPIRAVMVTKPKECKKCIKDRVAATGAPEILVLLPNTALNGTPVFACPWCDGQELIDLATAPRLEEH